MPTLVEINVSCNWGSTGRIAEQIGRIAQNKGWTVYMAHGSRYVGVSTLKCIEIGSKTQDRIHYLWNSLLLGDSGSGSRSATKKLLRFFDQIRPDVIHLHNIHGYYINYEILFSYIIKNSIPVVWTLHDCWPLTGHCTYFDSVECEKWKTECSKCDLIRAYPSSLIFDLSKRIFGRKKELFSTAPNMVFVPVSNWLNEIVHDSAIGKHCETTVIYNGIDLNVFRPITKQSNNRVFRIIGVASGFGKRKGFDDFLRLRELLPEDQYEIVMVGLSKQQLESLPRGIIGIQRTDSVEELVALYNSADVFLNATYSDNFPTTNIESLACGIPIITYRTGGSPEAIIDVAHMDPTALFQITPVGVIVKQGEIDTVAKIVTQVRHGIITFSNCREYAMMHFDKESCFEQYVLLYNSMLKNRT